jgi:hypothetical protein
MAEPIHQIKPSFSGGEFAPSLWARVDIQKYATGARKLLNFFVHPHGGISNRPGLKMVAAAKNDESKIRLIPFEFASDENYVIELGADSTAENSGYARFFYNDAQVTSNGTIVTLTSLPWLEADIPNLRYAQSADVLFVVHPDYAPRQITRTNSTTFVLSNYEYENGPFQLPNDSTATLAVLATTGSTTLVSSIAFFDATMPTCLFQLVHEIEGQSLTQAFTNSTVSVLSNAIDCGGTWRVISHGTWTGTFRVEKQTQDETGATSAWVNLRQFSGADDFNVDTYGSEDMSDGALPFKVRINRTTQASGTLNIDLTTDPYTAKGIFQAQTYLSSTSVSGTMQRQAGSTAAVSNWSEGAWSDYRGWPQSVVFAQDRLIFAGSYNNPQTIWMTQTGNYYNFYVNSPIVDSDGISINLPSQKLNEINGLTSLIKLLVFSSGAEWTVGGDGTNSALTPTSINVKMNSNTGSSGVQPLVIVNRAIYVQSRGTVVRDMGYDLFTDTFNGANLSILANHLFFNYNIVEMAFQQDPDSLVWAVRDDGKLLSMTYMREQEVLAWTQHDTYGGTDKFESVCCIPATGYNQVWFSVNRDGQRYIERMQQRLTSTARADQFFVDSGVTQDQSTSTDSYCKLLMHFDESTFIDQKGGTITNVGSFTEGWEVAYDSGELVAAQTSLTCTGLNGDVDEEYELICRFVNNGAAGHYNLVPNAGSGGYGFQFLRGSNVTASAARDTTSGIYIGDVTNTGDISIVHLTLHSKSGYVRTGIYKSAWNIATTTVGTVDLSGFSWNNTVDNITSLSINASATDGLGIGSRVILLKKSSTVTSSLTWEEVSRQTLTGASTSITISNLTGNTDVLYRLRARTVGGADSMSVRVRPNNVSTADNYGYQLLRGIDATASAVRGTTTALLNLCMCATTGDVSLGEMLIYAKSGYVRTAIHEVTDSIATTTVTGIQIGGQSWNNTADEITSLVIFADQTNGLGIGTEIVLEKLNL